MRLSAVLENVRGCVRVVTRGFANQSLISRRALLGSVRVSAACRPASDSIAMLCYSAVFRTHNRTSRYF